MTEFFAGSNRWLKTGFLLPIVALNGWVLIEIVQYFEPFVTVLIGAAVLAFILNYPVEFLQKTLLQRGFLQKHLQKRSSDRGYAVLIVLFATLIGLGTLTITLLPALSEQLSSIVNQLPDWFNASSQKLQAVQHWASAHRLPINLNRIIQEFTERLPAQIEGLGDETVLLTLNAVGGLSSLLLTIVLTFYLLLDGKRVWKALFRWLPSDKRDRIRRSLQRDFHRYFIGQATLGVILATVLSIVFFLLNIPYSLLLGSTIGVMSLVPFGDTLGYVVICLLLAAKSPTLALTTLGIVVILDQIIDQIIAPRILGEFTGLKPIWIIIALLFGTKLFGLPGLLIAVPIASFINNLLDDDDSQDNNAQLEPYSTEELNPLVTQPHEVISS